MSQTGTVYMDVVYNTQKAQADLVKQSTTASGAASAAMTRNFEDRLTKTGAKTAQVGKQMSTNLTLPLVGLGALAIHEFVGYEKSLASIEGLVGANKEQMAQYTESVRRIGIEFGIGADAAAKALYFITSSGLEGAAAIEALEQSAKASAIGLGDTETIADLLTSAINAYGEANLNAAQATDILTVAVREGKGDPAELAGAMSRVLPIASQLGVEFDEVSAAFASMSLTGTDANEAATQIRGIMAALLKPSKQAEEALAGVGLSSEFLRDKMGKDGLLPTLELIVDALGDDSAATAQVFDDVRALTGVMNILGEKTESTRQIFEATADSTGAADEAFKVFGKTAGFELNKSMSELRDSLIEIGEVAAPMVATIASGAAKLVGVFQALPGPLQTSVVGFAAVAAAAGPLVYVGGKIATAFAAMTRLAERFANSGISKGITTIGQTAEMTAQKSTGLRLAMSRLATVGAGLSFAGAAAGLYILTQRLNDNRKAAETWASQIGQKGTVQEQLDAKQAEIDALTKDLQENYPSLSAFGGEIFFTSDEGREKQDQLDALLSQAADLQGQLDANANSTELNARGVDQFGNAIEGMGGAEEDAASKTALANKAFDDQRKAVSNLQGLFLGALDGQKNYQDALDGIGDAQRSYQQSTRSVASAVRSVEDANRGVANATDAYEESLRSVEDAQRDVTEAQKALDDALSPEEDQIDLERARLRVEDAKDAVANPEEDATARDKAKAALDLRQAEIDLVRLQDEVAGRPGEREAAVEEAQRKLTDAQDASQDALLGIGDAQRQVTDASNALRDAQYQQSQAALAVQDAQDKAALSALELYAKQQDLTAAFRDDTGAAADMLEQLLFLQGAYPEVAAALQPYIDKLRVLQALRNGSGAPSVAAPTRDVDRFTGAGSSTGVVGSNFDAIPTATSHFPAGNGITVVGYHRAPEDIVNEIEQRAQQAMSTLAIF